jgi:peptide/nickel transport system substrate-binding protein
MKSRLLVLCLAFAILAAFAAACGDDDSTSGGGASDTIIIARQTDLATLDPHRAFCDTCQIYLSAAYQPLVTLKEGSLTDAAGVIAEKWDVSADLKTYTFHINAKAKFSDGQPITSADVKFSLQRLQNVKAGPSFFMDGVTAVDATDTSTVKVTLANADSAFLFKLMAPYSAIVEASVVKANGGSDAADADKSDQAQTYLDAHSAGSGPYMLDTWTRDTELRFKKNPNYWGPLSPKAQTIVIKEIKDASSQRQLLEHGDVDLAMNISQDVVDQLKNASGVSASFTHAYNFLYMEANATADPRLTKPVRQAMALAIDYAGVIKATVGGHGQQPDTTIPQGFIGTDLGTPIKQDLAKAKTLMSQGGQANGFNLTLAYPNQALYGVDTNILAQKIASDLAAIGIKITLQPLEIGPWGEQYSGGKLPLTLGYWAPDYPDSSEYVAWFGLTGAAGTPSAWLGNVVDDRIVKLSTQALGTADAKARAGFYKDIIADMQDDAYDIVLVQPDLVLANRTGISNNAYSPCCNLILGNLSKK